MKNSNLLLFADDANIFKTISFKSDTMLLQPDLNCFYKRGIQNSTELHINKCATISFSYKKRNIIHTLFNSVIQRVFIINDLGICFDVKLHFNRHIDKIRNKAISISIDRSKSEFSIPVVRNPE